MRKKIKWILLILLLILVGYEMAYRIYYDFKVCEEVQSPSGKYTLLVYCASRSNPASEYLIPVFSSQSAYRSAYVELRDRDGKCLLKPFFLGFMDLTQGEIGVEWDIEQNRVYYTKFDYIDLNKMKFDY